jgi:glycosyltransferase 2 family protein
MKLLINLVVALAIAGVCIALVIEDVDLQATWAAFSSLSWPALGLTVLALALSHLLRSTRWAHLLRPLGVRLPFRRLLAISSVGFMAIQALPVRLGEVVRPYLVVRTGRSRLSTVLGTVAVERVVDGLMLSLFFFGSYAASPQQHWSRQLQLMAWISLLGFLFALVFLAGALRAPERTVCLALRLSLISWLAPALSRTAREKLLALIEGFRVLGSPWNLLAFLVESVGYWFVNGLGVWILARGMGLNVPLVAAFTAMSLTGLLISLPNAPGLIGQFHLGVVLALAVYLPSDSTTRATVLAYATLLHAVQFGWYTLVGLGCLPLIVSRGETLGTVLVDARRATHLPGGRRPDRPVFGSTLEG